MRVLGVLVSELESSFTLPLCNGVLAAVRERGDRVVFLRGGLSGEDDVYDRQFRISFRLADIAHLDGFLVCASTIQHHLGVPATKRLIASLPKVPVVSLGLSVEGVPSLVVDNYGGAFEIVSHLMRRHACRRVAIIGQLRAKGDTDLDLLVHALDANLVGSPFGDEFFIRKAVGWALRQHARTDPDWVRTFVAARGDRLSTLSRREALKHLG